VITTRPKSFGKSLDARSSRAHKHSWSIPKNQDPMKRNVIISALLVWNVTVTAALIYVLAHGRQPASNSDGPMAAATPGPAASNAEESAEEFIFNGGERLNSDVAPQIANRGIVITATVEAADQDGVIVAQGGLAHGYTLYVQDGELFFAARRSQTLTTVPGGKLGAGRHTITANWAKTGDLALAVDGGQPITAKAAGAILVTPTDGLDVGNDRYAAVGPYATPNPFGGVIERVSLRTVP
jgi:hypothetical protein